MIKVNLKKRQYNLSVTAFMAISLASLVLFLALIFAVKHSLTPQNKNLTKNNQLFYNHSDKDKSGDLLITKAPTYKEQITAPITNGSEPTIGEKGAPITIVEFADFSCSFCAQEEKVLKAIIEKYQDKIRLIRKDYPVSDYNSGSYQAAVAGRCAEEQKKFWEYHDLLYQENSNLYKNAFLEIARELNLNEREFEQCLNSEYVKNLIDNNIKEADDLGISGVPHNFINSWEIAGEATFEEIENIIKLELKR